MRIFKHLVALADITVGFLGLFFIIFAVTRPVIYESVAQISEQHNAKLKSLNLIRASSGNAVIADELCELLLLENKIVLQTKQNRLDFPDFESFRAGTVGKAWPASLLLYADRLISFENVIQIIDYIKQQQSDVSIRLAVLSKE